jgi:phenylacetate-CoA ligase
VDYYTGGTTGSPFIIKTTNDEIIYNFAIYETRCKHRFSIKWGDESAVFLGKKIVPLSDRSGIYWRRASSIHQTFFSIYHMNNQTMGLYIRRLRELAPVFITGYVTPVYELARYIKDNNIEKLNIKAAFLSSETLLDDQKQVIEDSLGCQVCNGYSQAEGVAFISTSRDSLHISPDFGLVEFIPTEKQDIYEIIGTSLFNKTMPLIRYNTHDYVIIKDFNKLDKWGEPIIDSIIGREDGVIKTKDSRVISAASLSLVFSDLPLIERIQIIQEALDKVTVLVVSKYASNSTELNTLQKRISEILGQDFEVSLKCVDEIEKASNGKSRMIVSKI